MSGPVATRETWRPDQPSIRHLVARLVDEGSALAGELTSLLGAEARGRAADLRVGGVLLAGALAALLVGLAVASGAGVAALALALPLWAAALVVAMVALGTAIVLARAGLARVRRMAAPPERTLEVLREGVRALRAEAVVAAKQRAAVSDEAPSHRLGQPLS